MGRRLLFPALIALFVIAPAAWPQSGAYLWRAATGGQIRSRPAVGPDGTTYALSEDSYLYAWVSGSSLLWRHDLGWLPWDCLSVSADGTVYAGLKNMDFIAVNPRGGRLWTVHLDGLPSGDPAVAKDGTVLVGTSAGTLIALSHLGRREWSVTLPGAVTQQPAVDGAGTIYLVAADRRLYALTPWGEFKWSLPFADVPGAPAIAADGTVVLGTDAGDVVAVGPTGDVRWKKPLGAAVTGVAADAAEIVAGTVAGRVAGFSSDGEELWRVDAAQPLGAPPLIDGNVVLLDARDGSLLAIDPFRSSSHVATAAPGGIVVGDNGAILVGGRDWVVYAIDETATGLSRTDGQVPAPWPQEGHDAMHSGRTAAAPPSGNGSLLELNPDYLFLESLASAPDRESVQFFLSDVGGRIASHSLGKSTWYAVRMLENAVGLGTSNRVLQGQKVINDFPDLRAKAADLLGRVGTTSSRDALLDAVKAEPDGVALAAEIRALGEIASDGDGASMRSIVRAFGRREASITDSRLASAVVDAISRIAVYEGTLGEPSAIGVLLTISQGRGYDPAVRSAAQSVLQGDLKMDILSAGE